MGNERVGGDAKNRANRLVRRRWRLAAPSTANQTSERGLDEGRGLRAAARARPLTRRPHHACCAHEHECLGSPSLSAMRIRLSAALLAALQAPGDPFATVHRAGRRLTPPPRPPCRRDAAPRPCRHSSSGGLHYSHLLLTSLKRACRLQAGRAAQQRLLQTVKDKQIVTA